MALRCRSLDEGGFSQLRASSFVLDDVRSISVSCLPDLRKIESLSMTSFLQEVAKLNILLSLLVAANGRVRKHWLPFRRSPSVKHLLSGF
jgi:hypothetical protein